MRLTAMAVGLLTFASSIGLAAKIAVIDSGVDYKHHDLASRMWTNPAKQTVDADGAVYADDSHGWNFAEKNNQIIDYKYLGTFSSDCTKIFEVQAKILQLTATEDEKKWYADKKNDATFLAELQKFGNFVHGTHVSGISSFEAASSQLVGIKLIPTETPGQAAGRLLAEFQSRDRSLAPAQDNPFAKMFLSMLASQQGKMLLPVGKYTAAVKADVANGSFGVSVASAKPLIKNLLSNLLGQEPTDAELTDYAIYFINEVTKSQKAFVDAAKDTLFVFAAGNDGKSNDELPVAPANIKADNTISVAATLGSDSLASFSNYGSMVDVAAPGVAILSTVPGDATLRMSGTSMAAPFVTNVAGMVKDANPALSAAQIKKVLMESVDLKPFLQGKVKSGGIVNRARAVKAGELSKTQGLDAALRLSRLTILDIQGEGPRPFIQDIIVVPMPSLFY